MSKVIEEYSFSLESDLIEELNIELEKEMNKINTANGTEEQEQVKGTEEETEEVSEATRVQGDVNNWLYNFLTTNVNKASNIRRYEIEEEY